MDSSYNWQDWKCRCSAISKILSNGKGSEPVTDKQWETVRDIEKKIESGKATEKQKLEYARLLQKDKDSQNVVLGDTCIEYLLTSYAWETQRMVSITKELNVEAFERGRVTEPESVELVSFVDDEPYLKNETRFQNDFLTGIPDILAIGKGRIENGEEVWEATKIRELKSTRDYPTFLYKIHKGLDPGNKEQIQGYGDILDCTDLAVDFTLPNMPQEMREGYKYKLASRMGEATTESPRFLKAWAEVERSMIFDTIPHAKRVYKIPVSPFTEDERQAIYDRVKVCRDWLFNFHEQYLKLNK